MPRKRGNDLTTRKKRQDIEKQTNQFNFLSKHKKLELFVVKTMNRKNAMNSMTPKNIQTKPQFPTEKYNQIYDEEFVSLINSLNESIKEYYKVSKNN